MLKNAQRFWHAHNDVGGASKISENSGLVLYGYICLMPSNISFDLGSWGVYRQVVAARRNTNWGNTPKCWPGKVSGGQGLLEVRRQSLGREPAL